MMQYDPIISFIDVDIFQQDQLILESVNLQVGFGEWVYLIGKVGSGKSSLIKALYAELPVQTGEAFVAGFDLQKIKPTEIPFLRRKIGVIFQDFRLLTDRNVHDNLSFVLNAIGWNNKKQMENRIMEVIERVGMQSGLYSMPHELSGGEQQRITIARSLLNNPDIILADEPTGNLDPETSTELMEILKEVNGQGKTVLMATHDYLLLNKYASRTLVCSNGKLSDPSSATEEIDFSELLIEDGEI